MSVIEYSYKFQSPEKTYTLDQFIACQSDTSFCYANTSFIDQIDNIKYPVHNVVSDYIDEIIDTYCVHVVLSDDDLMRYRYRPKLLCYDVYGSQEVYFLILLINDMCSIKDFDKTDLMLPTKDNMKTICNAVLNSNLSDIQKYNMANKTTSAELDEKLKNKYER